MTLLLTTRFCNEEAGVNPVECKCTRKWDTCGKSVTCSKELNVPLGRGDITILTGNSLTHFCVDLYNGNSNKWLCRCRCTRCEYRSLLCWLLPAPRHDLWDEVCGEEGSGIGGHASQITGQLLDSCKWSRRWGSDLGAGARQVRRHRPWTTSLL